MHPEGPSLAWRRVAAKLVDALVSGATTWGFRGVLPPAAAAAIGLGWFALSDWSFSPGKWVFGLRTVTEPGGQAIGPLASVKRNLLLALPSVSAAPVGGEAAAAVVTRALLALATLAFLVREVWALERAPLGQRWGDRWAGTRVVREPGKEPE